MNSQYASRRNRKASPGEVYTKRLGRILKAHRQLRGITRKAIQEELLTLLREHENEPGWDDFRDLVDSERGGSLIELEDRGLAHEILFLPDIQLVADAYHITELMLDPARSKPVEKLISVYSSQDFLELRQEVVRFYGDGTQYYIPESQIYGTENVAIVRLKMEARPRAFKDDDIEPAHSDSHSHPGEELVFLKEKGSIEMRFKDSGLYTRLEEGHLIHFDARLDHSAWNLSSEESECLIIRFYRQISRSHPKTSTAAKAKALYRKPTQRASRSKASTTFLAEQQDSKGQREVIDRRAFGRFLNLLCSDHFRGMGQSLSLGHLTNRAKERGYPFSRSKLDRIRRGQAPVFEDDLPKLAEIYNTEPMVLYNFLLPDFHSAIAIHGQDDMDKIDRSFLPEGVTYWLPRRRLAFSETMIALLTLEQNCGTNPNRHPGQEIIILLEGEVRLQLGADHAKLEKGHCAHYRSYVDHSVWNVRDKPAKMLCIRMIC